MIRRFRYPLLSALLVLGACAAAGRMEVRSTGDAAALSPDQAIDVMLLEGERAPEERAFKALVEQALRDEGFTVVPRGTGALHVMATAGVGMQSDVPPRDRWAAVIMVLGFAGTVPPLFEGKAVAADRCGSLAQVVPALVHAIFETFPEGGRRTVVVDDDPTRCPPGPTLPAP